MTVLNLEENRTFRWECSITKPLILNNLLYPSFDKYAQQLLFVEYSKR
jgi:hypothetical protein